MDEKRRTIWPGSNFSDDDDDDSFPNPPRQSNVGLDERAYTEFMEYELGGTVRMAIDNSIERKMVVVKRFRAPREIQLDSYRIECSQLVKIEAIFTENVKGDELAIVYEEMHVSLRTMAGILTEPLDTSQIAAICKEVIAGLVYIHQTMGLYYGQLNCDNILLHLGGTVKLANIADCIINEQVLSPRFEGEDIHSLGFMMVELMDPSTAAKNPRSIEIQNIRRWGENSGILSFLKATSTRSLHELENHYFLIESFSVCFKAHVFSTLIAGAANWKILDLP